jgi:hypothetical protein
MTILWAERDRLARVDGPAAHLDEITVKLVADDRAGLGTERTTGGLCGFGQWA